MVVPQVELLEETADQLAEDDAGLGGVVGDVAGVLDELREVDLVEGEAVDLGLDLVGTRVSKGVGGSTWRGRELTKTTMRWATTNAAPMARPMGTMAYLAPVW